MRPARLGFRHALHAVHAGFEFEAGEHVAAGDRGGRLLEPAEPGLRQIEQFEAPAAQRRIALVHAEQIGGEQRRLVAAGAGAHFEDRVALVVRVLRQQRQLDLRVPARAGARAAPAPPPRPAPSARDRRPLSAISAAAASSASARRSVSMPSTIGPSSLYSFDNLANSAPLSPAPDKRRSAARRAGAASWSKRDSSTRSIVTASARVSAARRAARASSATSLCSPLSRSRTVATPRASSSSPSSTAARAPIRSARRMRRCRLPGIAELDDEPGVAQPSASTSMPRFGGLADRHQRDRARRRRRLGDQHRQPLDAGGPADPRHRRPAHQLDQPVVAAAGHHRALRAEIGRDELEGGVGVIVEAAHQARVQPVGDAEPVEPVAHPREERRATPRSDSRRKSGASAADAAGRPDPSNRGCAAGCGRAGAGCPPTVRMRAPRNSRPARRDRRRGSRGSPSVLSSSTTRSAMPSALQDALPERDDLDIGLRLRHPEQLDADLVELAEAALLRPLVAEHRAAVEEFQRRRLGQPVRQHRAHDPGGVLRPQRHLFAAAIGEGVHLLRHDVGVLADRPREDFGELEDRRRDLGKAVKRRRLARGLADPAVAPRRPRATGLACRAPAAGLA